MRVLVLNAGSSSLKASVVDTAAGEALGRVTVGWGSDSSRATGRDEAVVELLHGLEERGVDPASLDATGHRVVHGGTAFRESVVIDDASVDALDALTALAPLHNGVAVDALRATRRLLPGVPHVAAFDTAFHATLAPAAFVYPLPWRWSEEWGIRRFGFHGLSVEWAVGRAAGLLSRRADDLSMVVAHLGSGCSVTAVDGGRSVATSMGWTPLEGLMMGTRAGSIDPGILLRLLDDGRLDLTELQEGLNHGSGLIGVSGVSGDMRAVTAAAEGGDERARLALDMFVRRAAEGIAAATTSLRRLDALVFTGGIGENAGGVRARIVERLATLSIEAVGAGPLEEDAVISRPGSAVAVLRVEAREDVVIADEAARLLGLRPR